MRKLLLALVLCLSIFLAGCQNWMNRSYSYVIPHSEPSPAASEVDSFFTSYRELTDMVEDLISEGEELGIFYFTPEYPVNVLEADILTLQEYFIQKHPLGSYAVSDLNCEIGTNAGRDAIAVTVTYRHKRSEIKAILQADTMADVRNAVYSALDHCEVSTVVMVEHYRITDFSQLVADFAMENPDIVMETPSVSATVYGANGQKRLIEIIYTYQTSRDVLRSMRNVVTPIFSSASLYVSDDASDHEKYSQLYAFLAQRYDYRYETSITPSYSLLRHGVGDSKAFATVYASMCAKVGIPCQIVSGTMDGTSRFWNIICEDGYFYHVDIMRCIEEDDFLELTDLDMENYVWNYTAYPECKGNPENPR